MAGRDCSRCKRCDRFVGKAIATRSGGGTCDGCKDTLSIYASRSAAVCDDRRVHERRARQFPPANANVDSRTTTFYGRFLRP
eukprot:1262373-Prymnesium_polylepis.1